MLRSHFSKVRSHTGCPFVSMLLGLTLAVTPLSSVHACENWDLTGPFSISQSNNLTVTGTFQQVGKELKGKASYFSPTLGDHGTRLNGEVSGSVDGDALHFNVYWYGGYVECSSECVGSTYDAAGVYDGSVSPNGRMSGLNWAAADPAHKVTWSAAAPASCMPPAPKHDQALMGAVKRLGPINRIPTPINPNSRFTVRNTAIAKVLPQSRSNTQLGPPLDESPPVPRDGTYDTTFGTLTLSNGSGVYSYKDGRVSLSRIEGNYAEGTWEQSTSDRQCPDGRYYGRMRFEFTKTGFVGKYSYCEDDPVDQNTWNGTRM